MFIPVTKVFIKTDRMDNLEKILEKMDALRKANPQRTMEVSVEVSLRD